MAKRQLLQKIGYGKETMSMAAGYLVSEKLDGIRVFWDGGVTRGQPKADVPWANTEKDDRFVKKQVSTGLWTKDGHPVYAPDYWLDALPKVFVEGELYLGRGLFEKLVGIARKQTPVGHEWQGVKLVAFDAPHVLEMLGPGKVSYRNYNTMFDGNAVDLIFGEVACIAEHLDFEERAKWLADRWPTCVDQRLLFSTGLMRQFFKEVTDSGGEGIVLKARSNFWTPHLAKNAFKIVPIHTSEGILKGFKTGKVGKEGRTLGKIGSLILDWGGKRLDVSGMDAPLREFETGAMETWAEEHPGVDAPSDFSGDFFDVGMRVQFEYKELSAYGVPKNARYKRIRHED